MILPKWKEQVSDLICTGSISNKEMDNEEIDLAYFLLNKAVSEDPALLLDNLTIAAQNNVTGMIVLTISIVLSKTNNIFLSDERTLDIIYFILSYCDAKELLNIVKNLKYRTFNKGFGSKQQKIIRRAMEAWTTETLKTYLVIQPKQVYGLLRLVHPRFRGERGNLIKDILNK